ncbi:MAG: glycosyltransferase [Bacteroidetes bacterium]|jgi:glycosyltransferase involved in cell wall biosynthesis|nr:glycosyltransferase [Bacteroidota bacterium]|tara:strand:+ start:169 stop:1113 length:945 start_codon:yes stop_codon:yes gene_type:complete
MDISVVIPLYNEEGSLIELNDWILKVMRSNHFSFEIIYIDDGSSDNSWQFIQNFSEENTSIKGIRFRKNYGKSAALNEGFKVACGEVVITMDSDLQDSPDEIPGLFKMITEENLDIVSGWKKKRYDSTFGKNVPSKIFNWTSRRLFSSKLHDMNCGLKAYKLEVVKNIDVYGEMHRYIPIIARSAGFSKIGEKIVVHQKRKYGTTKFGIDRFMKGYLDLLSINFVSRFAQRPMHFFGSMGSLIFFIGFVIASYLAYAKFFMEGYKMTERPLFYFGLLAMVIGTQLFLTGFLAEMISRISRGKTNYQILEKLNIE